MDFAHQLVTWFKQNRRDLPWRRTRDPWSIWVSEVMLQQTQVETVTGYYRRFLERFPTVEALAGSSLDDALKLWEGLGYYARIRNLHRAAGIVVRDYNGVIPRDPDEFGRLPGVGPYIRAAVCSIAWDVPEPVVDGNVLRVAARWFGIDRDIRSQAVRREVRDRLRIMIPDDAPGPFNEAVMELGALVCVPRTPRCGECPVSEGCVAFNSERTAELPVRGPGREVPTYPVAIAVIIENGHIYVQQRPTDGHLGGLWEFPGGKIRTGETPEEAVVRECREEMGVTVRVEKRLAEIRHAYSHFKIDLQIFICRLDAGNGDRIRSAGRWILPDEMAEFAFPAANHKFFPRLRAYLETQA